jgi:hypothetical protein
MLSVAFWVVLLPIPCVRFKDVDSSVGLDTLIDLHVNLDTSQSMAVQKASIVCSLNRYINSETCLRLCSDVCNELLWLFLVLHPLNTNIGT